MPPIAAAAAVYSRRSLSIRKTDCLVVNVAAKLPTIGRKLCLDFFRSMACRPILRLLGFDSVCYWDLNGIKNRLDKVLVFAKPAAKKESR